MTEQKLADVVEFGSIPGTVWTEEILPIRNLMQSREWLETATKIYGQGDATKVLVIGDVAKPRALAVLTQTGSMGSLRLAGTIDIGESVEVLFVDEAALEELAHAMVRLGVALDFGHYPKTRDFAASLRNAQGYRGITLTRDLPKQAMPSLALDETWKEPLNFCSRSRRQQHRRKWRKAEELGPVEVEIITPTEQEVDATFERILSVEEKSWKGRAGTALRYDPKQELFFRQFGRRLAALGCLRLCFLKIGDVDAAMTYAVVWKNRFWAIKVGYDDSFAAVSPGEALLVELISHSAEQNYTAFEFCGKEARWTKAWTNDAIDIQALRFYPWTPVGAGKLMLDVFGAVRQRMSTVFSKPAA